MYNNNIGDQGAIAIAEALKFNAVMETLYLGSNKIGDLGATAIAGALQVNAVLKTLYLTDNKIGDAGAAAIADALRVNGVLTALNQALNLHGNKLGEDSKSKLRAAVQVQSDFNLYGA